MDTTEPKTPLARWMKSREMDDPTLSAHLGVSRVQVSRLRRGICKASPETARKLSDLTGLSPTTFIYGDAA
jgi:plasmid maintenance system antidote protein VapI